MTAIIGIGAPAVVPEKGHRRTAIRVTAGASPGVVSDQPRQARGGFTARRRPRAQADRPGGRATGHDREEG